MDFNILFHYFFIPLLHLRQLGQRFFQFFVCRNIIAHLAIVKSLISHHIKISRSGQAEYDILLFSGFLALHSFVNGLYRITSRNIRNQKSFSSPNPSFFLQTNPRILFRIGHNHRSNRAISFLTDSLQIHHTE